MEGPHSWLEIGLPAAQGQGGISTIADRAFCFSGRSGNLVEAGPQGFFYEDTRFLSEFVLSVNGNEPEVVDAGLVDSDEATFQLRSRADEQGEHEEPRLLVERHRYQGPTLHEDITVRNLTSGSTSVVVEVALGSDFAHLLDVRTTGPALERHVDAKRADGAIEFTYAAEGFERSTRISTSEVAQLEDNHLRFLVTLDPGAHWKTCLDIVPVLDGRALRVERTCTRGDHSHEVLDVPTTMANPPRLRSSADALEHLWVQSLADLASLEFRMDGYRAFAAGIPWFVALFGRDSIITAIESMLVGSDAALGTAELLAVLQGRQDNPAISEEPGKIIHEVRFGERGLPRSGGERYYGSVDATPLYCMLLGRLWDWGADSDRLRALLPSMRAALGWIEHRLEIGDGLLTYEGDERLVNHAWKDSADSMVDGSGELLARPIAPLEAQGYAVAALRAGAALEADLGISSRRGSHLALAEELQTRIEDRFWIDQLGTFAMAIGGDGRVGDAVSSNPGHLLWAGAVRPERAAAVAASLVSKELWSGWGVRTMSTKNRAYSPISYHLGSVWPHDTMLAIAGLFRYGHVEHAQQLAGGLLAASSRFSYQLPELFSGFARSEVPYPVGYPTSSVPQAWAAAVPVYLTQHMVGIQPDLGRSEKLTVSPKLPPDVEVALSELRIGQGRLSLRAHGASVQILEVPPDVEVVVR